MFKEVATLDDFWSGEMRGVSVDGQRVLLVNVDGVVHAYEDRCAHQAVRLSEGRLEGDLLTCSAHEWQYDIRTGCGVNPANVAIRRFAVEIQEGRIRVDVQATPEDNTAGVGPVLEKSALGAAVAAAIGDLNPGVRIVDRGAYLRVLVSGRCQVTRSAIEAHTHSPVRFPGDLESVMPSFTGSLRITEDEAVWEHRDTLRKT